MFAPLRPVIPARVWAGISVLTTNLAQAWCIFPREYGVESRHTAFRANGASYFSLGRSPRDPLINALLDRAGL
jgi:hypothetical protein